MIQSHPVIRRLKCKTSSTHTYATGKATPSSNAVRVTLERNHWLRLNSSTYRQAQHASRAHFKTGALLNRRPHNAAFLTTKRSTCGSKHKLQYAVSSLPVWFGGSVKRSTGQASEASQSWRALWSRQPIRKCPVSTSVAHQTEHLLTGFM